ncbi:hypothetical protein SLS58_005227 [Diplodia intermedia]|uniref:F-box domain-containing protein n=1 Tax=Diplodia intermedia TaxID=856260 RepID=A0ABR3TR44_9PEZI
MASHSGLVPPGPSLDRLPEDIIRHIIKIACREDVYEHGEPKEAEEPRDPKDHVCNDSCVKSDDLVIGRGRPTRTRTTVRDCYGALYTKETMSLGDILNLRLTCKGVARSLQRWYEFEFAKSRVHRTGHAEVSVVAADLRYFHASSKSWIVAHAIKSLHVNVGRFTTDRMTMQPLTWAEDVKNYRDFFLAGDGLRLLCDALTRLPNLEAIYVGKWKAPHILDGEPEWYEGDQTRRWKGHYGPYPAYNAELWGAGRELRASAVRSVLTALALTWKSIKKLVIHSGSLSPNREEAGIWGFDALTQVSLGPCFQNLKSIHLTISLGQDKYTLTPSPLPAGHTPPAGHTEHASLQMLLQLIDAVPQLESFHLAASGDNVFREPLIARVLDALPGTVSDLHLYNALTSVAALCRFLASHRRTLASLGLCRCYLTDESWTPVFRLLETYIAPALTLHTVHIEQLWELHPDFADKLFFYQRRRRPHNPAVHGIATTDPALGHRIHNMRLREAGTGAFDADGTWHRRHFRHDAMAMAMVTRAADPPATAGALVHEVRAGLRYAVRCALRETFAYANAAGVAALHRDDVLPAAVVGHACGAFGRVLLLGVMVPVAVRPGKRRFSEGGGDGRRPSRRRRRRRFSEGGEEGEGEGEGSVVQGAPIVRPY